MFSANPFAELAASVPPALMQSYVVIMIGLVAAGTLFDVVHKGSAKYFFENMRWQRAKGAKPVEGGAKRHRSSRRKGAGAWTPSRLSRRATRFSA